MDTTPSPWLFGERDEMAFKKTFAVQFLASYAATHYNDACARGDQEKLQRLPVEDAEFLAKAAWDHWRATLHPKFS
jgi:hypothetical protein